MASHYQLEAPVGAPLGISGNLRASPLRGGAADKDEDSEPPVQLERGLRRPSEELEGPPLMGPLSGLEWAGGPLGFASWRVSSGALRFILDGVWRAAEVLEFVGPSADPLRQVRS